LKLAALALPLAVLLAGCSGIIPPPASASAERPNVPLPASVTTELPRVARPSHYAITVTPDATALTFTGQETVDLDVFEPTATLALNAAHITIQRASVMPASGGAAVPLTVSLDSTRETATFTAPVALRPGAYRLAIDYAGRINRQPSGFFALDYPDKRTGRTTRGLFTQFEVPDAREFAVLFDEPSYKATFDLSAVVPAAQLAVSNMPALREEPLGNGLKRVTFATSPKMSSYLLMFAVGDFERTTTRAADGTEVGIVAPAGSGETARYTREALAQLVPYYNDYFGVRFPLPKIDNVAAPGQSQTFGAMENWGAILTFEKYLLLDPKNTSPQIQQYMFYAQAHEFAHQWFGDLVTMAWWDDLWLNEGFASWFETKATDLFHPEWSMLVGRVNKREAAMALDSLSSNHPIVTHIRTASEADSAFDAISYSKGESIVSMLEAYAGEERWRDGVRRYMAAHAYGNAVTADLWRAQEEAGVAGIARVADSFTRQPGVPLVSARQTCAGGQTSLSLTQGEFSRDRRETAAQAAHRWLVPLTVRAADGSLHRQLLDGTAQMTLPGCGAAVVNGGQLGYFRTLYETPELAALAQAMPGLPAIDQLGLVQDNLALANAGYQDFAPALELLREVPSSANSVVAKTITADWGRLYGQVDDKAAQAKLAGLAHAALFARLEQLGFDPKPGESVADTDLRATLLGTFGNMADPAVVAEARRRFARLQADRTALDGPLKTTWLAIVSRNTTPAEWELLHTLGKNASSEVEKHLFYSQLANAVDDALAQRTLELALTDEPGATTSATMVDTVSNHHPDLAYDFALAHEPQILAMLDDYSKADFIPGLAGTSRDPAMEDKLLALRAKRPDTQRKEIDEQLAALRERLASGPRIRQQILAWLAGK
jgi:aminopeptidase N